MYTMHARRGTRPIIVITAALAMASGLLAVGSPAQAGGARTSARAADVLAGAAASAPTPKKAKAKALRARHRVAAKVRGGIRVQQVANGVSIKVQREQRCVTFTDGQSQVWALPCGDVPAPPVPKAPKPPKAPTTPAPTTPTPTVPLPGPSVPGNPGSPSAARPMFGFYPGNLSNDPNAAAYNLPDTSAKLGAPGVVRVFFPGLPPSKFAGTKADVGVPVVVSFKASPADVAAGAIDDQIRAFLGSVPADRQVWWSFYHEPEDNIEHGEFTAEQYRAAWVHLLAVAPRAANLHPTLILMRWDLTIPTRRPIGMYVVPGLEVLAWDAYIGANYGSAAAAYPPAAAVSRAFGLKFAIAETSIESDSAAANDRTNIVKGITQVSTEQGAAFVTWFESNKYDGDWRLSPHSDAAATWRQLTH